MRHHISAILALISFPAAINAAEPEVNDTITVIENAANITVKTTQNSETAIVVKDSDGQTTYSYLFSSDQTGKTDDNWNLSLPFLRDKKKNAAVYDLSVCINPYVGGSVVSDNPSGLHGSVDVGLSDLFRARYIPTGRGFSISIGLGMGYRQYTLGGGNRFESIDRRLNISPRDENMENVRNRLGIMTFNIPVMLTQRIGKHFAISAGGRVNFNTYAKASFSCDIDGLHFKETYKGLHQRLMTVDAVGKIGFPDAVVIYVSYSPMKPFENGYGPQFKTLSFGLTIGF